MGRRGHGIQLDAWRCYEVRRTALKRGDHADL
jgi:hypothetical protein